jgi:hypothetical protein
LSSVVVPNPESVSTNFVTVNAGGGVIGFLKKGIGVRGDVRYFRAYGFDVSSLEGAGLRLNHFDFWRASAGVVFAL